MAPTWNPHPHQVDSGWWALLGQGTTVRSEVSIQVGLWRPGPGWEIGPVKKQAFFRSSL